MAQVAIIPDCEKNLRGSWQHACRSPLHLHCCRLAVCSVRLHLQLQSSCTFAVAPHSNSEVYEFVFSFVLSGVFCSARGAGLPPPLDLPPEFIRCSVRHIIVRIELQVFDEDAAAVLVSRNPDQFVLRDVDIRHGVGRPVCHGSHQTPQNGLVSDD